MSEDAAASDESDFWERRQTLSISPTTEEDLKQRTVRQSRHLVLLAHITDEAVISRIEPVLERLGEFECFAPEPARNLHVTVKVLGNVVEEPDGEDEFTPQDEHELVRLLRAAIGDTPAFTVDFPRLNLFPSVIYAEVADNGQFAELNRRVCDVQGAPVWGRDRDNFIPHLTLGHFTQRDGYDRLLQYLEETRSVAIPSTSIADLKLVTLDLSEGQFPPFETVTTYKLSETE